MKPEAISVLTAAGIAIGQDFSSLSADQVNAITAEAEAAYERKHGKPMPADSREYGFTRKRYDLLQRRARS